MMPTADMVAATGIAGVLGPVAGLLVVSVLVTLGVLVVALVGESLRAARRAHRADPVAIRGLRPATSLPDAA